MKCFFISSGVFPFVSGTKKKTTKIPVKQMAPKRKYVPDGSIRSSRFLENLEMRKDENQFQLPATVAAMPLASKAKNSPFIVHGIGPRLEKVNNSHHATMILKKNIIYIPERKGKYIDHE